MIKRDFAIGAPVGWLDSDDVLRIGSIGRVNGKVCRVNFRDADGKPYTDARGEMKGASPDDVCPHVDARGLWCRHCAVRVADRVRPR